VEGGTQILNSFIQSGIWDEARVFIAQKKTEEGVNAPLLDARPAEQKDVAGDQLLIYKNQLLEISK